MTSPPTFSKWSALGNVYWLVERADLHEPLDAERVRDLGADGVVEVVSTAHDQAEVVIWNPDGSTAELSGNGQGEAVGLGGRGQHAPAQPP